jgi:arginine deiminase
LLGVPETEINTMGTNVLALAPGKALIVEGNPLTEKLLKDAGCEVMTYKGVEISLKTEGGPTCLTRPILRLE